MHNAFTYIRWIIAASMRLKAFDNYGQALSFAMVAGGMFSRGIAPVASQAASFPPP